MILTPRTGVPGMQMPRGLTAIDAVFCVAFGMHCTVMSPKRMGHVRALHVNIGLLAF